MPIFFGSLVRYKQGGRERRFSVQTHNGRSVSYPLLSGRDPGYRRFFSGVIAFQTDTRMCGMFHPWTNFNPRAQPPPAGPRETVSQNAKRTTSGIARIAFASSYKSPSTSSSFLQTCSLLTYSTVYLSFHSLFISASLLHPRPTLCFVLCHYYGFHTAGWITGGCRGANRSLKPLFTLLFTVHILRSSRASLRRPSQSFPHCRSPPHPVM
jgi:hypothetical protein